MVNAREEKTHSALKTLLAGSLLSIAGTLMAGIFNYLIRRILALELSPSDYGFVYSAVSLAMLGFVMTDIGMAQAITIETAKANASGELSGARKLFSDLLFSKLGVSLTVFAVVGLAVCEMSPERLGRHCSAAFLLIWSLSMFYNLENISKGALLGLKDYKAVNALETVKAGLTLLAIWLSVASWGLYAPALAMPLLVGLNTVAMLWLLARRGMRLLRPTLPSSGWIGRFAGLLGWLAASSALLAMPGYTDSLALAFFKGLESAALYNIAIPLVQLVQGFLLIFPIVFLPISAELWKAGDIRQLRRIYAIALISGVAGAAGCVLAFGLFGRFAVRLLFNARFEAAAPAATILAGGCALFALGSFLLQFLNGGGRQREAFYAAAAGIAVNIAGHLTLTPRFGVEGAAFTTALSYLTICALASVFTWQALKER